MSALQQTGLQQTGLECRQVREAATRALDWLDEHHLGIGANVAVLRHDLDRAVTEAAALARSSERPAAIGVLGPVWDRSSVTGRRLLSALAMPRDPRLPAQFAGGQTRLALADGILPADDGLGASAIVRLTRDDPGLPTGRPADTVGRLMAANEPLRRAQNEAGVKVELLSLADVIMLLSRAYFANVTGDAHGVSVDEIDAVLRRARAQPLSAAIQPGLAAHQVYEIRDYLEARYRGHARLQALAASGYWQIFAGLAARGTSEARQRLASLIWGGLADFDLVFSDLCHALDALNHNQDVLCAPEAVRLADPDTGWTTPHPRSILAAATLLAIDRREAETVTVRSRFGQPIAIRRPILATLAREICLSADSDPSGVLASADVLALPSVCPAVVPRHGGISAGVSGAPSGGTSNEAPWLARALLQAKTLYLAERSIADFELNGLVVLVDPAVPFSDAFAPVLANWVALGQGRSAATREGGDIGLFLAVAASPDAALQSGPGRAMSWHALSAFLADFGGGFDWLDRWGNDQAFDNVFILGPGKAAGPPTGRERFSSLPGQAGASQQAQSRPSDSGGRAIAPLGLGGSNPLDGGVWLRHVRNTSVALDEALNTEDGGIRYLVQSIGSVSFQRMKRRQIAVRLGDLRRGSTNTIRRFLYASSPVEDGDWRHSAALATQARLRQSASANRLGRLIRALSLDERELRWLFERVVRDASREPVAPEPIQDVEVSGVGTSLALATRPHTRQMAHQALPPHMAAEWASRYSRLVFEHWLRSMRMLGAAPVIAGSLGFDEPSLAQLVDEIVVGSARLELEQRLAARVERVLLASGGTASPAMRTARAANQANEVLSQFLSQLGFDTPWATRHPKRRGTLGAPLFERHAVSAADALNSVHADRITLQYCSDWCEAITVLTEENIASARGMRYDAGEFRELEELLAQFGFSARDSAS